MIDPKQFRQLVVRQTLRDLASAIPYSLTAENLLVGTAIAESRLSYLAQVGGGPALGVFQVEPATHRDLWDNFLAFRPELASAVRSLASQRWPGRTGMFQNWELVYNLSFACAIARCVYFRSKRPLPEANDAAGLARYHEIVYNTRLGAVGKTPKLENLALFRKVIAGGEWGPPL